MTNDCWSVTLGVGEVYPRKVLRLFCCLRAMGRLAVTTYKIGDLAPPACPTYLRPLGRGMWQSVWPVPLLPAPGRGGAGGTQLETQVITFK